MKIKLCYFPEHNVFVPVSPDDARNMRNISEDTIEFEDGLFGWHPDTVLIVLQSMSKGEEITFVK